MKDLEELRATVATLRAPGGCPWDREQTHESLLPCLVEECSEVLEAVDRGDHAHLREELGDLLLSVFLHARIAEEEGRFSLDDVAREINEKLIRRHPHVFGPGAGWMSTDEVLVQWEKIKAGEKAAAGKAADGLFKDLPPRLPALYHASETAKRIRKKRLPPVEAYDPGAASDPGGEDAVGRALFELAAVCDREGWDPEALLRRHCDRVREETEAAAGQSEPSSTSSSP